MGGSRGWVGGVGDGEYRDIDRVGVDRVGSDGEPLTSFACESVVPLDAAHFHGIYQHTGQPAHSETMRR